MWMKAALAFAAGLLVNFPAFAQQCLFTGGPYKVYLENGKFRMPGCGEPKVDMRINAGNSTFVFRCGERDISFYYSGGRPFIYNITEDIEYLTVEDSCES